MFTLFPSIKYRVTDWSSIVVATVGALGVLVLAACGSDSESGRIFFTSDRDGDLEIYSVSATGKYETNVTNSPDNEFAPVMSPDGKLVAFRAGSGSDVSIQIMREDGTSRTVVTQGFGRHGSQRWSPEGDRLAYIAQGDNGAQVFISAADGTGSMLLTSIPVTRSVTGPVMETRWSSP